MHIYFSAIGGVGIGPLAMLALDSGYTVSGSDLHESDMTKHLEERGASIFIGQDGSQIKNRQEAQVIDWFVYSSALPEDHPELMFAQDHGIKASKRDEFLNHFLAEKDLQLVAVAGTHGKTTTTGMLVWLMQQLSQPVSYSIGTSISFGPAAQYQPGSQYFVYECDEFDRNFLSFKPHLSLVVSVDYDHPDTYPTRDEYNGAFQEFINQSSRSVLWQSDADTLYLTDSASIDILTESDPAISQITLPGEHVRRNAWLVHEAAEVLLPDIEESSVIAALNTFPGTNRRFEKLDENLYSDYAHHPTEIFATLQMAKEVNPNVVIIYQPHQNIRQHEIMREGGYKDTFEGAKKVYWLPTYLSREYQNLETLDPNTLVQSLSDPSIAEVVNVDENLAKKIKSHQVNGDLVLAMSAGDLDSWLRRSVEYV